MCQTDMSYLKIDERQAVMPNRRTYIKGMYLEEPDKLKSARYPRKYAITSQKFLLHLVFTKHTVPGPMLCPDNKCDNIVKTSN